MRFYVAAYVGVKDQVKALIAQIENKGYSVTVDWTDLMGISGKDRDKAPEIPKEIAVRDINGVGEADVMILLAEPTDGRGKYVELGAAIMSNLNRGKPQIFVVGEETHQTLFYYHPTVRRCRTVDDVFQAIESC